MEEIGGGVALIAGAGEVAGFEAFRQNNDFYYLCGVEVPHAYLLIDGGRKSSTLYLQQADAKQEETDGAMLGPGEGDFVRSRCGVVESAGGIALMRRAGELSARAAVAAMRVTRAGMFEYQLQAPAEAIYLEAGARGGSYRAIIASGKNIPMMHYWRNNSKLVDGEM